MKGEREGGAKEGEMDTIDDAIIRMRADGRTHLPAAPPPLAVEAAK